MKKLLVLSVLVSLAACTKNKFSSGSGIGTTVSASADGDPADPSGKPGNNPNGKPGTNSDAKPGSDAEEEEPDLSNGGEEDPENPSTGGEDPSTGGEVPNECVEGGTIKFQFEGPIKACYDSGRVWNFDTSECLQMRQSTFACEWPNVIDAMAKLGISNSSVTAASASPEAKLVGCGESADKNRIVVQWVNIPEGKIIDCKNPELTGSVITGCFTFYPDNNIPPPPASAAERDKQVYACMSQL